MCIFCYCRLLLQKGNSSEGNSSVEYIKKGDCVRPRPKLAATLKAIMENGFDEFYTGATSTSLVNDIRSVCAEGPDFCRNMMDIITSQDLREYEAKPRTPFSFVYNSSQEYDVYTAPAPFGGPSLAVFLGIVTGEYR